MGTPPSNDPSKRPVSLSHGEFRLLLGSGFGIVVLLFFGAAMLDYFHEGDATSVIVAIVGVSGVFMGAIAALFNKLNAIHGALNGEMDTRIRTIVKGEIEALERKLFDRLNEFTSPPNRE